MSDNLSVPIELSRPHQTLTRTIYCQNSGVVLGELTVNILEGHLPYLQAHGDSLYFHPFYQMESSVVLKKLQASLHQHQDANWIPDNHEIARLRVLVSAVMFQLGVMKQDRPSLPSHKICVASAGRLLGIARWYYFISSQRLELPQYSVSGKNSNLEWENFRFWLDGAYKVREEWANESKKLKQEAQVRAYEESIKDIKSEAVKRVDLKKVWSWMDLQFNGTIPAGRRETFKNLFLSGDLNASDWISEDVEDLKIAIVNHCDIGNDITYFINNRLDGIQAIIKDFYSGFTIIRPSQQDKFGAEEMTPQEMEFFASFDRKAEALEELPVEPLPKDFASKGLYFKAIAQYRILSKRYAELKGDNAPKAQRYPDAPF